MALFGGLSASSPWRKQATTLLIREDAAAKAIRSSKIAGFDLNDTLVSSKIGAPGYQVTVADWKLYSEDVVTRLRQLHEEQYKLVIFTNQGNIRTALDGKRAVAVKAYIDEFLKAVGVPILVMMATAKDKFRKPSGSMWTEVESKFNGGTKIDYKQSFYVGDAAGGPGEHSADDSEYAATVGVRFVHVRDYFKPPGASPAASAGRDQEPSGAGSVGGSPLAPSVERGLELGLSKEKPVVLVLVGAPGCGKSTFAQRLGPAVDRYGTTTTDEGKPWRRVCQDILQKKEYCLRASADVLRAGHSVVIDRTNYNREQREPWLDLAMIQRVSCHCLVFDVSADVCCARTVARTDHEGKLQGGSSVMVVRRLCKMLQPIAATESFDRVRVVRTTEDLEKEISFYTGAPAKKEEAKATGPGPSSVPSVTMTPPPARAATPVSQEKAPASEAKPSLEEPPTKRRKGGPGGVQQAMQAAAAAAEAASAAAGGGGGGARGGGSSRGGDAGGARGARAGGAREGSNSAKQLQQEGRRHQQLYPHS
uniref:Bifunctional polynucleotide phosphatase/kinase n=1 Tax=Crypthecodinium cohnii TaxID=2866 RepID=A0A516AGJ5_CRYCO|nr:bifunctional polynucleotide phosphatase/kinase [Crypthecodinium cohnii]